MIFQNQDPQKYVVKSLPRTYICMYMIFVALRYNMRGYEDHINTPTTESGMVYRELRMQRVSRNYGTN